jgi:hypothetical protein
VEDWIGEDNPVRVTDVLVDGLDPAELGFGGVDPEATGRPSPRPIFFRHNDLDCSGCERCSLASAIRHRTNANEAQDRHRPGGWLRHR